MKALRVVALVVGVGLHAASLVWLVKGDALAGLLTHATGALAWGYGIAALLPPLQRHAWWQPTAWALSFPLAGPAAALALAAILHRPPVDRSAKRYVVWDEQAQEKWEPGAGGAARQSIVQILQSPRTQLRRNAVLALRDLDPQLAIPLLRKGLQDSDEQVRIYSQNILSSTLERFELGIKQLEQRFATEQIDPVSATRLAEQYFELVYLDIAGDEETAAHYLAKALALLEQAATKAPADKAIAFLGLKYALRARDVPAARRWLTRVETRQAADAPRLIPWRMELAFLERNWTELRGMFQDFIAAEHMNPRIEETARYWLGMPAGNS